MWNGFLGGPMENRRKVNTSNMNDDYSEMSVKFKNQENVENRVGERL